LVKVSNRGAKVVSAAAVIGPTPGIVISRCAVRLEHILGKIQADDANFCRGRFPLSGVSTPATTLHDSHFLRFQSVPAGKCVFGVVSEQVSEVVEADAEP
jgi:hypothetical protein